ncbi:MAG: hypothetical protein GX803_00890 [Lentisphaerae bacterium]|jgi:tetratricopeptide (TPR) repeat protein|nr:hypothetical protein [Lentisphaerota bacterium]
MSKDLGAILEGWDYDPDEVRARYVRAADGSRQIQLRLDLGVFQMRCDGRPDGLLPKGHTSLRDFYFAEEAKAANEVLPYYLEDGDCAELQQEVMQYYYRMMAYRALGDLGGVIRDSEHILDLIDLASEYAENDETAWQFIQLYPYMRMMNIRAQAELDMKQGLFDKAERIVKEAITDLEQFYLENYEAPAEEDGEMLNSQELASLKELLEELDKRRPRSEQETLEEELAQAVALEHYEKAAFLRDRLKGLQALGGRPSSSKKRIRPPGGRESSS